MFENTLSIIPSTYVVDRETAHELAIRENRNRDHAEALLMHELRIGGLTAVERDEHAAQRQAEALGATFAQREKLRAIVTERRNAIREAEELRATVEALRANVQRLEQEQISGDDYRLQEFWERAMQNAERENYCGEYDRMAELLGGPRREREWEVSVTATVTFRMTTTASSTDEAIDNIESLDTSTVASHLASLNYYSIDVDSWEGTEAEER